jgi:glycosyltransferase involved in cell wall biosynthesis
VLPSLSVIIPTLNEVRNLPRCLDGISRQAYPGGHIEVLVVDGGSTDGTKGLVQTFADRVDVKLLDNSSRREAEFGKALALECATGELVQFVDADMWPSSHSTLANLARPLAIDGDLAGAVSPYMYDVHLSLWNRFLSCDELQRDPLLQRLTPNLGDFVMHDLETYKVCQFSSGRMPPIGGTTMFRREEIDTSRWLGHFREVDHPASLVNRGRNRFAYVNYTGWIHNHCDGLRDLVRKRVRNLAGLRTSFLLAQAHRDFVWFDPSDSRDIRSLVSWVITTNLLVPRLIEGIRSAVSMRKWEPLLRPIVAIAVTDTLLLQLVRTPLGRDLIRRILR